MKSPLLGLVVTILPAFDGIGRAKESSYVTVNEVVAKFEHLDIELRLVIPKACTPDPWIALGGKFGSDDFALGGSDLEVGAIKAVEAEAFLPFGNLNVELGVAFGGEVTMEMSRDGFCAEGVRVNLVGDVLVLVAQGYVEIDNFDTAGGCLFDERTDFVTGDFFGDPPAGLNHRYGFAEDDAFGFASGAVTVDEVLKIFEEVVFVFPVVGFGVVGAEFDDDDIGLETE